VNDDIIKRIAGDQLTFHITKTGTPAGTIIIQPGRVTVKIILLTGVADIEFIRNSFIRPVRQTGKITLAVRLGDRRTRSLFVLLLILPFLFAGFSSAERPLAVLAFASNPIAAMAIRPVVAGATGRDLIPVLEATGKTQLAYGLLLTIGLWIG
jgi:1,4-dihydroxy-2-naphthoate octaprenyltransferase